MKVYFNTNFWGGLAKEPGQMDISTRELQPKKLNREFVWEDISGFIPAIYTGSQGMAVDFCIRVSNETVEDFYHKWEAKLKNQADAKLSEQEKSQMIETNPLSADFFMEISVNGEKLENTFGCSACYSSILSALTGKSMENSLEKQLVQEYGCDEKTSWIFMRHFCKWEKEPDFISSLDIDLKPNYKNYICKSVEIGKDDAGKKYALTHPVTGQRYELYIHEVVCEEIDRNFLKEHLNRESHIEYPTQYMALSYELIPELPQEKFQIRSIDSGDQPRGIQQGKNRGISILVGGGNGPNAYFIAGKRKEKKEKGHFASSSTYFTLSDSIQWQPVFMEKEREEMRLHVEIS